MFLSETLNFSSPVLVLSALLGRWTSFSTRFLFLTAFAAAHLASLAWFPVLLPLHLLYAPAVSFLFPLRGRWGGPFGTVLSLAVLAPFYFLPPFGAGYSLVLFILLFFATFWVRFFALLLPAPVAVRILLGIYSIEFLFFPASGLSLFLVLATTVVTDFWRKSTPEATAETCQWLVLVALTLGTYRF
jgi:hypothetical protein